MKIRFLALIMLFTVVNVTGQTRKEKKDLKFYNDIFNDPEFEKYEAPEKWSAESAVYLGVQTYLSIAYAEYRGFNRKRILLQDQNAVNDYAEYYFQQSETVFITITKKNGKEIVVNLDDAIEVNTQVPSRYANRFQSTTSYKLAIPNLEIGDIIDFTSIFSSPFDYVLTYTEIMNFDIPTVHQNITFDLIDKLEANCHVYNVDASVKELFDGSGFNRLGNKDDRYRRYEVITKNLEPFNKEKFKNAMTFEPVIKFMAMAPKTTEMFLKHKDIHSGRISLDDMLMKMFLRRQIIQSLYLSPFGNINKENYATEKENKDLIKTPEDHASKFYYDIRENIISYERPVEALANMKQGFRTFDETFLQSSNIKEEIFISFMTSFLDSKKYEYDIVALMPNYMGSIERANTFDDVYFGVRLKDSNKYFFAPRRNTTHIDYPSSLKVGAKGRSLSSVNFFKNPIFKDVELPTADWKSNYGHDSLRVMIDLQNNKLNIAYNLKAAGSNKDSYAGILELFGDRIYTDFLDMYKSRIIDKEVRKYEEKRSTKDSLSINEYKAKSKAFNKKYLLNLITNSTEADEKKVEIDTFFVSNSGRSFLNPTLDFQYNYNDQRYITKSGPNYILEVGRLIGGQFVIDESDKKERNSEIYNRYPRHLKYKVELQIPEGYKIADISNLKKSLITDFCSFEADAVIQGNMLIITTLKVYKQTYLPKDKWAELVKMLEEAYQFSQEKIVLKKA